MRGRRVRLLVGSFVALLAVGLSDCGSSTPVPTGGTVVATPTPVPCTQTTLLKGAGAVPAHTADFETHTVSTSGRIDVTVDWTYASSLIGVFLTQNCTFDQFKAGACNFLIALQSPPKPLKGSASVSAGTYTLIIVNAADQAESLALNSVLSSTSCPALASAGASAAARDLAPGLKPSASSIPR
jgi:hypothetical protein